MPNTKCLDCEEWGYYEWGPKYGNPRYKFNEDRSWTGCRLKQQNRTCVKNAKLEVEI